VVVWQEELAEPLELKLPLEVERLPLPRRLSMAFVLLL
jgi:hypothetical protein